MKKIHSRFHLTDQPKIKRVRIIRKSCFWVKIHLAKGTLLGDLKTSTASSTQSIQLTCSLEKLKCLMTPKIGAVVGSGQS